VELQQNTPALAPLRGKDPLRAWVTLFSRRDPDRAERYREALALFLGHPGPEGATSGAGWSGAYVHRSPKTLKEYRYAVVEFFEFLARYKQKVVPPHEVTRRDAFEYAEWLAHRGEGRWDFTLEAEKLKDGDRDEDLAVYQALQKIGQGNIADVARSLPRKVIAAHPPAAKQIATGVVDEGWLEGRLLGLMRADVITRSPTLDQIRREYPRAGFDDMVDPLVYEYTCVPVRPVSRSTIALRLAALSAFWSIMQKGENADEKKRALLDYNVFDDALKAVTKNLGAAKREASMSKRPTAELVGRIVAVADGPRLVDKRNVALLWFLMLTGARISEALHLRRAEPPTEADRVKYPGWLDRSSDPVTVVLLRKGGVRQPLALPPYVLSALTAFWNHMAELVPEEVGPADRGYRYRMLLREPDAPLFPPVGLWGRNRGDEETPFGLWGYRKSMSRQGVQKMLMRLSEKAGLNDAERRRIHPHGFRHLAAEAIVAEGSLREAQVILGHTSVQTTEQYLPSQVRDVQRSAQNEILDYLAKKGFWGPKVEPVRPTQEPPSRAIETYGRAVEEEREVPKAARREPERPGDLPSAPAAPIALLPPARVEASDETALVAIGHEVSDEGPVGVYEVMAEGKKPPDLAWSSSPQAKWIAKNYAELPVGYGIGKESLLPWWNKDAPQPWPVLAPSQAYPELCPELGFLRQLERLYDEWTETKPTATLAMAQWLHFLGMLTVALESKVAGTYSWVTFSAKGTVGEDFRAHLDSWLVAWFEKNAHTFTTAQRRFAKAPAPTAGESEAEYWGRVRQDIGVAGLVPTVPQIPHWYFEPDPVHTIWERDPKEFKAFVSWIAKLTGQKESELRTESRDEQLGFFEKAEETDEQRARGYIEQFYNLIDEIKAAARDRSKGEQRVLEDQREALRTFIQRQFNIKLPRKPPDDARRHQVIRKLLNEAFRSGAPAAMENVLGDSRMFSKDAFRIDQKGHTITHTELFRERFAQEHWGRDSECVMRRIARALWEKSRQWEYATGRKLTEPEQRRELFITQLSQLAYVVPCPPDVEQMLVARGRRYWRPQEIADFINKRIVAMVDGEEVDEDDEITDVSADVIEAFEEVAETPAAPVRPPREPERPRAAAPTGRVRRRRRTGEEELLRNARRAAPHPLRLVAATFWPV
jgi:integrase